VNVPKLGRHYNQKGFTLVELLVVIAIIGMTVGVGILMVVQGGAGTDVRASAEIVKQDLRKVYSMADDAKKYGPAGSEQLDRDQYKIVFHDDTVEPKNAYIIMRYWNESKGEFEWNEIPPDPKEVNRIVEGTNWIRPTSSSDIDIKLPVGGTYEVTFESKGSVMTVKPLVDAKYIKIESRSKGLNVTIDISDYGDITS
jgi:prepilin-type N-terminal cleavage/methylation domain-containing protein